MAHNVVCKNADMAIQIIKAVAEAMKQGTQKDALIAVSEWIREQMPDMPDTPEERKALALKIETEMRNCMSVEQRRAKAAFYLEGLKE